MKGVSGNCSVALMAQKFQNLAQLGHDTPPPPPQSQPPIEEAIESLNGLRIAEATVSNQYRDQQIALSQAQLLQHSRHQFELNQQLNQELLYQQQAILEQRAPLQYPLEGMPAELLSNGIEQMVMAQVNDVQLTGQTAVRLIEDLQRLMQDHETADVVFVVGHTEVPISAHRVILRAR